MVTIFFSEIFDQVDIGKVEDVQFIPSRFDIVAFGGQEYNVHKRKFEYTLEHTYVTLYVDLV